MLLKVKDTLVVCRIMGFSYKRSTFVFILESPLEKMYIFNLMIKQHFHVENF